MLFTNKFQLHLTSSNNSDLNFFFTKLIFFLKQNKILNFLKIFQIFFPFKNKKFTLLKSPHIFKTARTQLEIRTFKQTIIISNFREKKEIQILKKNIQNLIKNLPTKIKLKIKSFKLLLV